MLKNILALIALLLFTLHVRAGGDRELENSLDGEENLLTISRAQKEEKRKELSNIVFGQVLYSNELAKIQESINKLAALINSNQDLDELLILLEDKEDILLTRLKDVDENLRLDIDVLAVNTQMERLYWITGTVFSQLSFRPSTEMSVSYARFLMNKLSFKNGSQTSLEKTFSLQVRNLLSLLEIIVSSNNEAREEIAERLMDAQKISERIIDLEIKNNSGDYSKVKKDNVAYFDYIEFTLSKLFRLAKFLCITDLFDVEDHLVSASRDTNVYSNDFQDAYSAVEFMEFLEKSRGKKIEELSHPDFRETHKILWSLNFENGSKNPNLNVWAQIKELAKAHFQQLSKRFSASFWDASWVTSLPHMRLGFGFMPVNVFSKNKNQMPDPKNTGGFALVETSAGAEINYLTKLFPSLLLSNPFQAPENELNRRYLRATVSIRDWVGSKASLILDLAPWRRGKDLRAP